MLIEIITSYSHSISIVSNTFDILLFLSSLIYNGILKIPGVRYDKPVPKADKE